MTGPETRSVFTFLLKKHGFLRFSTFEIIFEVILTARSRKLVSDFFTFLKLEMRNKEKDGFGKERQKSVAFEKTKVKNNSFLIIF